MTSKLHERLKAARLEAKLTLKEVGASMEPPISRVAVGLWESMADDRRTSPSVKQLAIISKITGAPLEWLSSDDSDISDDWHSEINADNQVRQDFILAPILNSKVAETVDALRADPAMLAATAAEIVGASDIGELAVSNSAASNVGEKHDPRLFGVLITDNSMSPIIDNGDGVIVDPDAEIVEGALVLVKTIDAPGGLSVRRAHIVRTDPAKCAACAKFKAPGDCANKVSLLLEPENDRHLTLDVCPLPIDADLTAAAYGTHSPVLGRVMYSRRYYG